MAYVKLKLNSSYPSTSITINDLGDVFTKTIDEVYTTYSEIKRLLESVNLTTYIQDDAYGVNSSTIIVNDGTSDINTSQAIGYISQQLGLASGLSLPTSTDASYLELELAFTAESPHTYRELIYTGDKMTTVNHWETPAMLTKLYQVDYTYTGDLLTTSVLTRISDSATLTKTFIYSGDTLLSVERS